MAHVLNAVRLAKLSTTMYRLPSGPSISVPGGVIFTISAGAGLPGSVVLAGLLLAGEVAAELGGAAFGERAGHGSRKSES